MNETNSGIAGIQNIIKKMQDPEEFEPGRMVELEHLVNGLAQSVMSLGNAVLQAQGIRDKLMEDLEAERFGTGASNAYLRLAGGIGDDIGLIAHLERIGRAMAGSVRIDIGVV